MNSKGVESILAQLVGKKLLQVNVDKSTGSIFSIDIGNELIQIKKKGMIFHEGEYIIMVYCSWRLLNTISNIPVTGWHEDSAPNGALNVGLKTLVNDTIKEVGVTDCFDLEIIFESGKRLDIFCDLTTHVDADTNWFFKANGKYYSISNSLDCKQDNTS